MSSKFQFVNTLDAPQPIGPYSQAIAYGDFLFCSGQIALHPQTGELPPLDQVEAHTEQILKNIQAVLKANSMDFSKVVKTTIFLTKMSDFPKVNEVYAKHFGNHAPARSTVAVSALPKGVPIEIEVIACK